MLYTRREMARLLAGVPLSLAMTRQAGRETPGVTTVNGVIFGKQNFETALAMSKLFYVTLDIGHFTAGNNDAVAFIRRHHDRIKNIHVRDRKRDNGPNRPFGQGDTPIRQVLRLIRDNKYPIRAYLEYEYGSFRSSLDEVKTCFEYCKDALG